MQLIKREKSWLTGKSDLKPLYCFPEFPVHMMADSEKAESEDLKLDMKFSISAESGSVQIENLVPEEILYKDSHFQTIHSSVWKRHNEELAKEIAKLHITSILEIGGGTGILAKTYNDTGGGVWRLAYNRAKSRTC